jgi:2-polyprenyl-3-methyl-5-hydroxy-6-metoxy-1,4-benzoquinol methylase
MSATSVSVLVPLIGRSVELPDTLESIEHYLQATGFEFDIRVLDKRDGRYGAMLRRGVSDSKGSVVVVVDANLPYPVSAIGDAVAMVESGAADVVFAHRQGDQGGNALLRTLLVSILPDPALHLKAFSAGAARLLFGESKLAGAGFDLEVAYLANKYGFRVERLELRTALRSRIERAGILSAIAIRLTDRRNGYRAARRCPVCFSSEVWSWAQIPGNVVRSCGRCKSKYLNRLEDEEATGLPVRRELRAHTAASDPLDETSHARTAREKTSARRLTALRRHAGARARVLEIGVRDGSFGAAAAREFEYVGIDRAPAAARAARAKGLEVYCSALSTFVNTGPSFDAVTLHHVLENMADPHDALARIKDLLKPGGVLMLTTFDTEGLLFLMTERKWMAHAFRTHRILYSRSAMIELLEHSGIEILAIGPDFEYRDHRFVRHMASARWPSFARVALPLLKLMPDPLMISSGSIRIVAKRRAGAPVDLRAIRSIEPTHAR